MHASHSVDASELMNRPAEHAAQADEPDALAYLPTRQAKHTSTAVAPTTELELPGVHLKHSVEPEPETYVPAEHLPHSDDPKTLAKLPGVHGSHTDAMVAPIAPEKVPREHISQADIRVSLPQLPALQNAHCEVPRAPAKRPISQSPQSVVELDTDLNFPSSHAVHWEAPFIFAKLPG
jgi:hypothetical protein